MSKIPVKHFKFNNATSFKLPNRRVTVFKEEDGFAIQWLIADELNVPHAICERIRGKVSTTYVRLTPESAECLMLALREQLGYEITKATHEVK
jgi:hypothetical protein